MEDEDREDVPLNNKQSYKNFGRILGNVFTVALGSLFFGYGLAYISILPIQQIQNKFGIDMTASNAKGLFSGILPVGAGLGALSSSIMNKKLSRKNSIIATAALSILGSVLTLIPSFVSLLIGRVIQGVCVGLYSAIVPLFINEISPKEISGMLGSLNQLFIVSGIVITNIIALFVPNLDKDIVKNIENDYNNPYFSIIDWWWIIFAVPIVIAALQIVLLLLIFKNETPRYLISQGRQDQALQLIGTIYNDQYVETIFRQKKAQVEAQSQSTSPQSLLSTNEDAQLSPKARVLCVVVGVHLAVLQQLCGVNVVVLYGGQIISEAVSDPQSAKWMQVGLIATQFVACLATSYVLKKNIGRKTLLQIGTLVSFVVLLLISVGFLATQGVVQQVLVIVSLYVFMTSFGFTLGPVVWLYIPQIVAASVVPYTTLANWVGASVTIILFPILGAHVPFGYLFVIFAAWCLASLAFGQRCIVETMNKTDKQIKMKFNELTR